MTLHHEFFNQIRNEFPDPGFESGVLLADAQGTDAPNRTNGAINPSAEIDAAGYNGSTSPVVRTTADAVRGVASLETTLTPAGASYVTIRYAHSDVAHRVPVTPGRSYATRWAAKNVTGLSNLRLNLRWRDTPGNLLSDSEVHVITAPTVGTWTDLVGVAVAPAGAATVGAYVIADIPAGAAATLTTALAGANDDLTYTADAPGSGGNAITVEYANPGVASSALAVTVTSKAIRVSLATDAASAITSTAAQVRDAVNAHVDASALVTAANATGNDGTGVVTAMAATALTGGTDVTGTLRVDALLISEGSTVPPYFDGDTPGYFWNGTPHASTSSGTGVLGTVGPVSEPAIDGAYSLRLGWSGNASDHLGALGWAYWDVAVAPGEVWSAACRAGFCTPNTRATLAVEYRGVTGSLLTQEVQTDVGQSTPVNLVVAGLVAPAGAWTARIWLRVRNTVAGLASGAAYFDRVMVNEGDAPFAYFDGDSGGARWSGARFHSPSERAGRAEEMDLIESLVPPYYYTGTEA